MEAFLWVSERPTEPCWCWLKIGTRILNKPYLVFPDYIRDENGLTFTVIPRDTESQVEYCRIAQPKSSTLVDRKVQAIVTQVSTRHVWTMGIDGDLKGVTLLARCGDEYLLQNGRPKLGDLIMISYRVDHNPAEYVGIVH
jgi:hypothetical protein